MCFGEHLKRFSANQPCTVCHTLSRKDYSYWKFFGSCFSLRPSVLPSIVSERLYIMIRSNRILLKLSSTTSPFLAPRFVHPDCSVLGVRHDGKHQSVRADQANVSVGDCVQSECIGRVQDEHDSLHELNTLEERPLSDVQSTVGRVCHICD